NILKSNQSQFKKDRALATLDEQAELGTLTREIEGMEEMLPKYEEALKKKAITEGEYAQFYNGYVERLRQLNDLLNSKQFAPATTLKGLLTNKLSDLFGFKKGTEEAKLFAETITQTFDLA